MKFEASKNGAVKVYDDQQIRLLGLPSGVTREILKLRVGQNIFHYDTLTDFKRVE